MIKFANKKIKSASIDQSIENCMADFKIGTTSDDKLIF